MPNDPDPSRSRISNRCPVPVGSMDERDLSNRGAALNYAEGCTIGDGNMPGNDLETLLIRSQFLAPTQVALPSAMRRGGTGVWRRCSSSWDWSTNGDSPSGCRR